LARVNREHDVELAQMQQTKDRLRKQIEELQTLVDLEREARRAAEEKEFKARRSGGAP
jgi:hypothetical protein